MMSASQADALLHSLGIGFDGRLRAGSSSTSLSSWSMRLSASARGSRKCAHKTGAALGREKLVVICHLRQITDALARDGWRTSMPKRYAAPRVGGTKPSRTLMAVVLPAPFGPESRKLRRYSPPNRD